MADRFDSVALFWLVDVFGDAIVDSHGHHQEQQRLIRTS
jgi:hypothetical protein